ncbi:MAG: VWA domain-containing protein [Defluviitaleaceae bacterium]|nr:VWA domain-containing protein [Defluviitaleaceae bacterium]
MKKKILIFLLILIFIPTKIHAEELLPIDAVLVLDVSRSMRTADPNRVSRDAMNLFIEKLTENRDRVAVVAYAGNVEQKTGLTDLHTSEDRNFLYEFINTLEYASWTDHGVGLMEAIKILQEINPEHQGLIIFLTDGNMNVNPQSERTNELAQEDVDYAIFAAQEMNVPIHTIGLNFDGNLASQHIKNVAYATNGLFFETSNAEDIPEIISAFFGEMIAAPQTRIYEAAPEPTPMSTPAPTPTPTPEPPPTPPAEEYIIDAPTISRYGVAAAAGSAMLIGFAAFFLAKPQKRVFTGKLLLEVLDLKTRKTTPPLHRNLIEFGNRASLSKLLGSEIIPDFNSAIFTPSQNAPSHLPQLQIKCKNPHIKFSKDFLQQDISKGVSISTNTEAIIETETTQVRIRYYL